MNNYSQYFGLAKQLKSSGFTIERAEVISEVTQGKKSSLKDLTHQEYTQLINHMRTVAVSTEDPAMNVMRRKVIGLFRKMGYETEDRADMKRIYSWVIRYGKHHKPLKKHTKNELTSLVTQVELVYTSYLKELDK